MPDGSKCDVMGLEMVKVNMFDGVVRTLGCMAYVPKLRKNLISLSLLDSKGCKCSIAGGEMKITCGCMVVMKGEKCGGLYRLVGNTVGKTKISKVLVKQGAQDIKYLRRVSFAGIAKTQADCFKVHAIVRRKILPAKRSNRGPSLGSIKLTGQDTHRHWRFRIKGSDHD